MPYIVTTSARDQLKPDGVDVISRRAVATLEEARTEAGRAVDRAEPFGGAPYGVWAGWRDDVALQLPESGGTVGPLPDGTVIEVEAISWLSLGAQFADHGQGRVIEAWNARQS